MPWYHYRQNNTGGSFIGPVHVVIEADDAEHANMRALVESPVYFDGCGDDIDCPCCGDRWHHASEYDAKWEPMVYNSPVDKYDPNKPFPQWHDDDILVIPMHEMPRTIEHKVK